MQNWRRPAEAGILPNLVGTKHSWITSPYCNLNERTLYTLAHSAAWFHSLDSIHEPSSIIR
jgi:hypothetical protein